MERIIRLDTESYPVELERRGDHATVRAGGRAHECSLRRVGPGEYRLALEGETHTLWAVHDRDTTYVHVLGRAWEVDVSHPAEIQTEAAQANAHAAKAPMPGMVVSLLVAPGDAVEKGQPMLIIESMKMQSEISARRSGTVDAVMVGLGESFERNALLVTLVEE